MEVLLPVPAITWQLVYSLCDGSRSVQREGCLCTERTKRTERLLG